MKVKLSGSRIIISAENQREAHALMQARPNPSNKEKVRAINIGVGEVDSETQFVALSLTLVKLTQLECDMDRQHSQSLLVHFPELAAEPAAAPEEQAAGPQLVSGGDAA